MLIKKEMKEKTLAIKVGGGRGPLEARSEGGSSGYLVRRNEGAQSPCRRPTGTHGHPRAFEAKDYLLGVLCLKVKQT